MLLRSIALAALAAFPAGGSAAAVAAGAHGLRPAVCSASCFAAPAGSGSVFLVSGHGWGHGVGMSQYGAYGYAQHGWTAAQILAHYYQGTTLTTTTASTVRVLLAEGRPTLELSSTAPFTVRDGKGQSHTLASTTLALRAPLKLRVDGDTTRQALPPPLTFVPGGAPLTLVRPYRGQIQVDVADGKLRAIDVVGLEQYLYGVVPAEMPSGWASEALKAQAVAARSYALATRKVGAPFDVYPDTRSQTYLGISDEQHAATAAVDATKGQVVTYGGKVATTYFFSSSGGRTESSADWTGVERPYLVSVPDPYDSVSPYHDWALLPLTGQALARELGLPGTATDARTTLNPAGRVAGLAVASQTEGRQTTATVPGARVRTAMRLRSTWFAVGVLSLQAPSPATPVTYGSSVRLSGLARGVGGVALEQRTPGSSWRSATPAAPAGGRVWVTAKPTIATQYRLATAAAATAPVRVRVAPRVRLTAAAAGEVRGVEAPALRGVSVRIERRGSNLRWTPVATGAADAGGRFAVPAAVVAGAAYRAVVAPGRGYAAGSSPALVGSG